MIRDILTTDIFKTIHNGGRLIGSSVNYAIKIDMPSEASVNPTKPEYYFDTVKCPNGTYNICRIQQGQLPKIIRNNLSKADADKALQKINENIAANKKGSR